MTARSSSVGEQPRVSEDGWYARTPEEIAAAFTAVALCLIVSAFECRSERDSVLTTSTFDSRQMNWVAPAQFVLAAEPMTDVDTTAADVLEELDEHLNAQDVHLVFAELKDPVRRKIERYGLTRTIDPRHFFPTVEAAVAAFRLRTGAEWTPLTTTEQPAELPPDTAAPPPTNEQ